MAGCCVLDDLVQCSSLKALATFVRMWYIYSCCLSQDLSAKSRAEGKRISSSSKERATVFEDGTLWAAQEERRLPPGSQISLLYGDQRKNGNTVGTIELQKQK